MVRSFYSKPEKFKGQNYEKLHKHYSTVLQSLFSDPVFPPVPTSIGISNVDDIKWIRPSVSIFYKYLIIKCNRRNKKKIFFIDY